MCIGDIFKSSYIDISIFMAHIILKVLSFSLKKDFPQKNCKFYTFLKGVCGMSDVSCAIFCAGPLGGYLEFERSLGASHWSGEGWMITGG